MADIIVVGSINTDLVIRTPRFPKPGETLTGQDLAIFPGGKGANQAAALSRLGVSTAMVGRIGRDVFGSQMRDSLRNQGVLDQYLFRDEEASTGTALILVNREGQNSIILSPGANGMVAPEDIDRASELFIEGQVLLLQLEIPMETVVHAARVGKRHQLQVVLNPAPARKCPRELLEHVDILIPNETELEHLSGRPCSTFSELERAAQSLLSWGVNNIIVTLGEKGALLVQPGSLQHIPGYQVQVVDTTAAGDAFIGGLASALVRGLDLPSAVQYGNACGAITVTRFGAQPSLPTADEVRVFIEKGNQDG